MKQLNCRGKKNIFAHFTFFFCLCFKQKFQTPENLFRNTSLKFSNLIFSMVLLIFSHCNPENNSINSYCSPLELTSTKFRRTFFDFLNIKLTVNDHQILSKKCKIQGKKLYPQVFYLSFAYVFGRNLESQRMLLGIFIYNFAVSLFT